MSQIAPTVGRVVLYRPRPGVELEAKLEKSPTVAEASKKAIAAEVDRQLDAALERLKGA